MSIIQKRKREEKASKTQMETLVQFMESHEDLARNKLSGTGTKILMWEQLTEILNNIDGAKKESTKWQRVWTDVKSKAKRKAFDIQMGRSASGGDLHVGEKLSEFDQRVLFFVSDVGLSGLPDTDEMTLNSYESLPVRSELKTEIEVTVPIIQPQPLPPEPQIKTEITYSSADELEEENSQERKRFKEQSSTSQETLMLSSLINQNNELNTAVSKISEKMDELIHEKQNTNVLLFRIAEALEKIAKK